MIDHSEARELLELAAVEPGGLDRIAAGDTADASILADHLAGCPACSAEADRLRAAAPLIREAVIEAPSPELRERTLALIREVGRRPVAAEPAGTGSGPVAPPAPTPIARRRRSLRTIALPLGMAAAIVLAIIGTAAVVNGRNDADRAASVEAAGELARLASWSLQVSAQPDSQRTELVSPSGSPATGTLLYAPTSTDLVVVARNLPAAPDGQQYRCWVLVDGARQDIGQMDTGGGLAYWAGPVEGLGSLPPATPFGVSLADANGTISTGEPALVGTISQ
jgi:hypothetical protein